MSVAVVGGGAWGTALAAMAARGGSVHLLLRDPAVAEAINARGEPADTGESRAIAFDSVDSGGHPSFILNTFQVALFAGFGDELQLNAALDVIPRSRDVSSPDGLFLGDYLDLKLAYAEYRPPVDAMSLSIYAGKFDSVLGVEYRSQEAPDRLSVTPSLLCRYTCGHPRRSIHPPTIHLYAK